MMYPPPPIRPDITDVCNYTVGSTDSGNTVLRIPASNGLWASVKLQPESVKQLIRLLEATLPTTKE